MMRPLVVCNMYQRSTCIISKTVSFSECCRCCYTLIPTAILKHTYLSSSSCAAETTTKNLRSRRHHRRKVHIARSRHSTRGRTTMTTCLRPFCTERTRTMPPCDQQAHVLPPLPPPRAPKHETQTRKKGGAASSHSRRVHGGNVNDYHCSGFSDFRCRQSTSIVRALNLFVFCEVKIDIARGD